jgi:hypothetical protein
MSIADIFRMFFKFALEDAASLKIAEYLHTVVAGRMGLSSSVSNHLPVA